MNNHPLNMLTSDGPTRQGPQSINDERQMALANLFNSLLNPANRQQQQKNDQHHNDQQQQRQQLQHLQYQSEAPLEYQQDSPPSHSNTITSSLQSAMAAAFMQQNNLYSQRVDQEVQNGIQQQQRINYCTICNKELCNKYFMKTHMLKMHGINLEMEKPESDGSGEQESAQDEESNRNFEQGQDEDQGEDCCEERKELLDCSLANEPCSSNNNKNKQSVVKNTSTVNQPSLNSSSKKSTPNRAATSVLNGYAGNSMGGVVCDICNKELCSKYFLKVHKQNTHGIMTDYQDANHQFMYPFANPLAGPNPFMAPTVPIAPNLGAPSTFAPPRTLPIFNTNSPQIQQNSEDFQREKKCVGNKRIRLSQTKQSSLNLPSVSNIELGCNLNAVAPNETSCNESNKQLESVYRLILAQQQQRLQPPLTNTIPQALPPALMPMEQMSANPLNALMCFGTIGATNPFGQTGMSAAMIVDNILRNQHLFNRNKCFGGEANQGGVKKAPCKDKNNNETKQTNSKTSKESSSNSRYFSHYTEACPMCDRRFKSIKWLKTHMMNDHKQEIGAYMQMMMQYLYASRSQQMAAASTIATLEQQQHLNQHLKTNSLNQQPTSLINKCFNDHNTFQEQLHQSNAIIDDYSRHYKRDRQLQEPIINPRVDSSQFINQKLAQQQAEVSEYAIDARCRQESLSPGASNNRETPISPSLNSRSSLFESHLDGDNHLVCGLNFELGKLGKNNHHHQQDAFLLSNRDSNDGSDIVEDDNISASDSEHRREDDDGGQTPLQIHIKTKSG